MTPVEVLHRIGSGLDGADIAATDVTGMLYTSGRDLVTWVLTHPATFANHIRGDLPN